MNTQLNEKPLKTTDNELICLYVSRGSRRALEELIQRHSAMVFRVCCNLLWNREDAEDAFQVVFLMLCRKAPRLLQHNSIGGWLHETSTRVCLQLRRKQARRRETGISDEPMNLYEPWQTISDAHDCEVLHREISKLPYRYREVLVLYHLEGKSRSQIADILDCSITSVKALLARARKRLRRSLIRKGIAGSVVLAGTASITSGTSAAPLSKLLVQSTLAHCCGGQPPTTVGNGQEFVKSLLTKDSLMTSGLFQNYLMAAVCTGLMLIMVFGSPGASWGTSSSADSDSLNGSPKQVALASQTEKGAYASANVTLGDTSTNNETPNKHLRGSGNQEQKEEKIAITVFQVCKLKVEDGKLYYDKVERASPINELVPQTYTVQIPVRNADGTTTMRTETRTRTVRVAKQPAKQWTTKKTFVSSTRFELANGSFLDRRILVKKIGSGELSVVLIPKGGSN